MKSRILDGSRVYLRSIEDADTENVVKWRNAPHVKERLYTQFDVTPEQHRMWMQTKVLSGLCSQFILHDKARGTPVGTTFLKNIEREHRKAEFGIFIGEFESLGKGIGSEATSIMIRHGFETLNLNKVYLTVFEDNSPAIRSYEAAGFRHSGLFQEDYWRDGRWYNVVYMEMLASEYATR
ncbi:GNAT family N-acetyltransferase [Desulfocurvibacter africanus]|uniref:GCN5-related N-acetyltransferase n=1 Tax=Desulfocurvibacter africanus subsp. africanus str. Walvis Bay TaxID=690850 RepID=F3YWH9_DESAF|nr:GNAT family protein [Desulfocurvibacter africanus]EGJ49365.1 GCN5-related N-acetyltransferase [Desulfocurvibacter africanus subsp. africanus str. Walvis Bay]